MNDSLVVEAPCAPSAQLSRASLQELIQLVENAERGSHGTWNVVEALELLMEAGHYTLGADLARRISALVGDARSRLFEAYEALCMMATNGTYTESLELIERRRADIANGDHSVADQARIGLIYARALAFGVAMGCTAEGSMTRARAVLGTEFERTSAAGLNELGAVIALELAKTHLYSTEPDLVSAGALLERALLAASAQDIRPETGFDLRRFFFHTSRTTTGSLVVTEESLRKEGAELGSINAALAELSIARRPGCESSINHDRLVEAENALANAGYISAAFEIAYKRGSASLLLQHFARAERAYESALSLAQIGGFLHGRLVSLIGLFQCAVAAGSNVRARSIAEELASSCRSELATGVAGLSVVAALQLVGDYAQAGRLARRCSEYFGVRRLPHFESQAAFVEGACYAGQNEWKKAERAWRRSLKVDLERGAILSASDKKAAVAQALAMIHFLAAGKIDDAAYTEVSQLLREAEELLCRSPETPELSRTKGKLLQTNAQLCVMAQRSLDAVRHLSRAREVYRKVGASRDVALIDALSGLALLEVAKSKAPAMFEEAAQSLQRALEFFKDPQFVQIRWKLKYYLSVAAYLGSQSKGGELEKMHWREIATGWLNEAVKDSSILHSGEGQLQGAVAEADFSPGLEPEVLEPLKKALGVSEKPPKAKNERGRATIRVRRPTKHLH